MAFKRLRRLKAVLNTVAVAAFLFTFYHGAIQGGFDTGRIDHAIPAYSGAVLFILAVLMSVAIGLLRGDMADYQAEIHQQMHAALQRKKDK